MSFGSKSLQRPTKDQHKKWAVMRDYGCICCRIRTGEYRWPEIHHLLSGGLRISNDATLALCAYHHRGIGKGEGPSLAHGTKPFARIFGTDQYLIDTQNTAIGLPLVDLRISQRVKKGRATQRPSKVLPR